MIRIEEPNVPERKPLWLILLIVCSLTSSLVAACKELPSRGVKNQPQIITKDKRDFMLKGELNASVEWTGTSFIVVNEGPSDWKHIVLIACPVDMITIADGAYTMAQGPIKAGGTAEVAVWMFRRATDQKRLDVSGARLRMFIICEGNPFSYSQSKDARRWYGVVR